MGTGLSLLFFPFGSVGSQNRTADGTGKTKITLPKGFGLRKDKKS